MSNELVEVAAGSVATGGDEPVPELIAAAGEKAVAAYHTFLDDAKWSPRTRRAYGNHVRRFCHWAEALGLRLELIDSCIPERHVESLSPKTASDVLSVLRGLFGHLVKSGVLAENPCVDGRRRRRPGEAICSARGRAGDVRESQTVQQLETILLELTAELDKRYGGDPAWELIKSLKRYLAYVEAAGGPMAFSGETMVFSGETTIRTPQAGGADA